MHKEPEGIEETSTSSASNSPSSHPRFHVPSVTSDEQQEQGETKTMSVHIAYSKFTVYTQFFQTNFYQDVKH